MNSFPDLLRRSLPEYGYQPSHDRVEAFSLFIRLLLKWNRSIRLVGDVTPAESDADTLSTSQADILVRRHLGESLYLGAVVNLEQQEIIDIGTGGGFPGLALAIGWPTLITTLVESNARKAAFLKAAVRELGLKSTVLNQRFDFATEVFVTGRALEDMETVPLRFRDQIRGPAAFWISSALAARWRTLADWSWQEPRLLPNSTDRVVLMADVPRGTTQA